MSEKIIVRTQEELNEVPENFEGYVEVAFGSKRRPAIIDRPSDIAVFIIKGERVAVAKGNSYVHAYEQSDVTARGKSKVKAYEKSCVEAHGKSYVHAYGKSKVEAHDTSKVLSSEESKVAAYDESHVKACEKSRVVANGESRVVVFDETVQVVQFGSSSIEYVK